MSISAQTQLADRLMELEGQVDRLRQNLLRLLDWTGAQGARCNGCDAPIYWFFNRKTGKKIPLDPDGTPHFASCPKAEQFRRKVANASDGR